MKGIDYIHSHPRACADHGRSGRNVRCNSYTQLPQPKNEEFLIMRFTTLIAGCVLAATVAMPALAHETVYRATLTGPSEAPPNASPGIGLATVTFDFDLVTMEVALSFSGLLGNTTASHIHCCTAVPGAGTAGVATVTPTFTGFPLGVTSGTYDHTFDMTLASSYNPAFITGHGGTVSSAMTALISGLDAGEAYLNIHTSQFAGGEIRGFLVAVPEPSTYALMLAGLGMAGFAARRRKAA